MDEMEQKICALVDARKDEIIAFAQDLWTHAELGFQEHRSAGKFAGIMKGLGLRTEEGLAVTGVKSYLKNSSDGPTICLMGELDGLPIPNHAYANPETGAAHCCGHNAQIASMVGVGYALARPWRCRIRRSPPLSTATWCFSASRRRNT